LLCIEAADKMDSQKKRYQCWIKRWKYD
jgi:hypothetical protein